MTEQTAAGMVKAAKERIENLSVDQVERGATGAIAGAVHAPRGMLEFYADPSSPYHRAELDPERRVILYCASSGRSALAVDMLQDLGYTRSAHLDGGIAAWKEAGKPVERA